MSTATPSTPAHSAVPMPSSLVDRFETLCVSTDPENLQEWAEFEALRSAAFDAILALPEKQKQGPEVDAARRLVEAYAGSDLVTVASGRDLARASACLTCGWNGVLAALLLAPVWQLGEALRLETLPAGLRPTLLFRLPHTLTHSGQADALLAHYTARLRELVRLAEANPGSSSVRAALAAHGLAGDFTLLCNSTRSLKDLLSLHGRLVSAVHGTARRHDVTLIAREGRRLKIGFVLESIENVAHVRAALPWFEHLDPRRFEVTLFTLRPSFTDLATQVSAKVGEPRLIGIGTAPAVQHLRENFLDVAVYFTRVTRNGDPVTKIAAHRTAPLQIAIDETRLTSGLPNADLALLDAGEPAAEAAHFTERVALLPPQGVPFVSSLAKPASTAEWTRAGLELPTDAMIYASVAPFRDLTPEWLAACARILGSVPDSRLLLYSHAPEDQESRAYARFFRQVELVMKTHGIAFDRIIVSNEKFPSVAEVVALLAIADLCLDATPVSQTEGAMLALEAGVPVLCCTPRAGRPGRAAGFMRALELPHCVTPDLDAFVAMAVALGRQPQRRLEVRQILKLGLAQPENVWDPVAFAESFGLLLERAFDEVVLRGKPGFGTRFQPLAPETDDPEPLFAEAASLLDLGLADAAAVPARRALGLHPTHPGARALMHRMLGAQFQHQRLADSLMASVDRQPENAVLWHRLAEALIDAGNRQDGLHALEISLRLDDQNLEGWLRLSAVAIETGNTQLAAEIAEVTRRLAPEDPRVQQLAS
jgi:protein O-GlcNAc transferase